MTAILLLGVLATSTACSGQGAAPNGGSSASTPTSAPGAAAAPGDTVSEMSKAIWIVFQDSKHNRWFGSDGQGVYRHDGKTLTQFTTKHGLPGDRIRDIQEDKSGNIYITTLHGISKFDGRAFTTLAPIESTEWKLQPDDLWFKGASVENGPYRYDGQSLYHLKFPKHYLEDEYFARNPPNPSPVSSPYAVYTIYKDRSGHLWFGTAALGACRYDGKTLLWLFEDHLTNLANGGSFGIRSIIEDKDGKFWFCNTQYRYTISPTDAPDAATGRLRYTREPGIAGHKAADGDLFYFQSVVDNNGALWMASYRDGVVKYDGVKATHYPVTDAGKETTLFSISKDREGVLWLGAPTAGAYRFNGAAFERAQLFADAPRDPPRNPPHSPPPDPAR